MRAGIHLTGLGFADSCWSSRARGECSIPGEENRTEYGALAGCYVNATEEPFEKNYQLYDYYTKELPELIGRSFNVIRGKYGVIGYSMGGHGSLMFGLREPEIFVSVSALAPVCHVSLSYFGKWLLTDHLGADADWSMYDAVELLKKHKKRFAIPPLIDQGDADAVISNDLMPWELIKACAEVNQEINLRYQKGYDHSYHFVSTFIGEHLEFHAKNLSKL
ncbi:hypothetical protein Aperf_G00000009987 [Anoplocephala perfoliata]